MNAINKILNRVNVLTVIFSDAENHTLSLAKCRFHKHALECSVTQIADIHEIRTELSDFPVIVLVGGYGVITKDITTSANITDKVRAADGDFLWSKQADSISFVRRQQIDKIQRSVEELKTKLVNTVCIKYDKNLDSEHLKQIIEDIVHRHYSEGLKLKNIIRPSLHGSALAYLIASRIKLPVSGIVLFALMINTIFSSKVQGKYESARTELDLLRKTVLLSDDVSRKQQEIIREYSTVLPFRISLMCDRIAACIPESILLSSMDVQPLTRSLEEHKKPVLANNLIAVCGESSIYESVAEYVSGLSEQAFASKIRLVSVEKNRDRDVFVFKIIIDL